MSLCNNIKFLHPFTSILSGPTGSGKTRFVRNLLFNMEIIKPTPQRVYYCYAEWQQMYDEIFSKLNVQFIKGVLNHTEIDPAFNNLIIFDDLMNEVKDSQILLNFFTKWSHHKNCSIIYITQNLFNQSKISRSISLNAQYIIAFNNPRDRSQIYYIARQMFPTDSQFLIDAYIDACKVPYGYLFLDLKQTTKESMRVQTGIFPNETNYVYIKR